MSIRRYLGYWTIFVNGKPVMSCPSFAAAWAAVMEVSLELAH